MGRAVKISAGEPQPRAAAPGRAGSKAAAAPADRRPQAVAQTAVMEAIDRSPRVVAQRAFIAGLGDPPRGRTLAAPEGSRAASRPVVQRTGTVVDDFMGCAKLYVPEAKTSVAAYYCHGVYSKQIDPVGGIKLGYLAPHGSTTSTNATAVELSATHPAETDSNGQWHSYILSAEGNASDDSAWLEIAERAKKAVAWIKSPTTTGDVVAALKGLGYTDILAVHCREVFGEDNIDWDPLSNQEVEIEGLGWLVERSSMDGWLNSDGEPIDSKTSMAKDDLYYSVTAGKSYKVMDPDEGGKVRICALE
jgi:hypothetical protein